MKIRAEIGRLKSKIDQAEIEKEWFSLAEKRLSELERGKVKSVAWKTIRQAVINKA